VHYAVEKIPKAGTDANEAKKGSRMVLMDAADGLREVPVFDRDLLTHGHRLKGPVLVESEQTTVLVQEGWGLTVDAYNNAVLEEGA
jgi:N-methylhydantoinase A